MRKAMHLFLTTLILVSLANAQGKVYGSIECSKPNPRYALKVVDLPYHQLTLEQFSCRWTKPIELAGIKSTSGTSAAGSDIRENKAHVSGYHVSLMENGDSIYIRYQGSSVLKAEVPQRETGRWSFTGGTGSFKYIRGNGEYRCDYPKGESTTCEVNGEYGLSSR